MNLTLFVAQLNQILQNSETGTSPEDVCDLLRTHTCAAVSITDQNGQCVVELLQPEGTQTGTENKLEMPIMSGEQFLGSLMLSRFGDPFSEDENLAFGVAFSICTVLLRHKNTNAAQDNLRRREVVRNLINTLSFSELEAATEVFRELAAGKQARSKRDGGVSVPLEGLLVAGSIADRLGFTRSVITSMLKKLEGANLIETRSLGMKGTYIRVKDGMLVDELGKL